MNSRSYHTGTVIGLLPAQTINVYLGSKLRSIHEVLNDHNAALGLAGYGVFVVEVSKLRATAQRRNFVCSFRAYISACLILFGLSLSIISRVIYCFFCVLSVSIANLPFTQP